MRRRTGQEGPAKTDDKHNKFQNKIIIQIIINANKIINKCILFISIFIHFLFNWLLKINFSNATCEADTNDKDQHSN